MARLKERVSDLLPLLRVSRESMSRRQLVFLASGLCVVLVAVVTVAAVLGARSTRKTSTTPAANGASSAQAQSSFKTPPKRDGLAEVKNVTISCGDPVMTCKTDLVYSGKIDPDIMGRSEQAGYAADKRNYDIVFGLSRQFLLAGTVPRARQDYLVADSNQTEKCAHVVSEKLNRITFNINSTGTTPRGKGGVLILDVENSLANPLKIKRVNYTSQEMPGLGTLRFVLTFAEDGTTVREEKLFLGFTESSGHRKFLSYPDEVFHITYCVEYKPPCGKPGEPTISPAVSFTSTSKEKDWTALIPPATFMRANKITATSHCYHTSPLDEMDGGES